MDYFDKKISDFELEYLRYSDDILVLGSTQDKLENVKKLIIDELKKLELNIKEDKMFIGEVKNGFDYLGFHFNNLGEHIPEKSIKVLDEKIVLEWVESNEIGINSRLRNIEAVIRGWEQYYGELNKPINIYHYLIKMKVLTEENKKSELNDLMKLRNEYICEDLDISLALLDLFESYCSYEMALNELYEYMKIGKLEENTSFDKEDYEYLKEKLKYLLKYPDNIEVYDELIQYHTDLGHYKVCEELFNLKNCKVESYKKLTFNETRNDSIGNKIVHNFSMEKSDLELFMKLFVGRDDMYTKETQINGIRKFKPVLEPLTENVVREHLEGNLTVGSYVRRVNNSVKYLVIDIDILKKLILENEGNESAINNLIKNTHKIALEIKEEAKKLGFNTYIEDSGFRGRHVWIFFDSWLLSSYALKFGNLLIEKLSSLKEDITIEIFPNKGRIKSSKLGQVIKLPLGIHSKTNKRALFVNDESVAYENQFEFLRSIKSVPIKTVRNILNSSNGLNIKINESLNRYEDRDIEILKPNSDVIRKVLNGCSLMRYLCFKSKDVAYLTHGERLFLSYVFGHLGEDGAKFLHNIMANTLNYEYKITNKFIKRLPSRPVSCAKLRAEYKNLTANLKCDCYFKLSKDSYPSPVLHAVNVASESEITLPVSYDTKSKDKRELKDQLDVHKSVEEFAGKLIEMKKQLRNIEKNKKKYEDQLTVIFDSMKTDKIDIDLGTLVREKISERYEWSIKI
jgi:hypothetical protein